MLTHRALHYAKILGPDLVLGKLSLKLMDLFGWFLQLWFWLADSFIFVLWSLFVIIS